MVQNKSKIKFWTKITLFEYFGLYVWESIVLLEISILEFVKTKISCKIKNF